MDRQRQPKRTRFSGPAALLVAVGLPISAWGWHDRAELPPVAPVDRGVESHGQPPRAEPATAAVESGETAEPPKAPAVKDVTLRFNFKDTPYEQIMDFVARQTGLPVIRETELPKTPVTFISASDFSLEEAIDVLNRMLFMHGVQLRREENFLLLTKLENMRALGPKFLDQVPGDVAAAQIVTVVVPLHNAQAAPLAEQLKSLVSPIGAITPLPQQNAVILVDTAAQCRRLRSVINDLDAEAPSDMQVQLFTLEHAKAAAVFNALKGLVSEKRSTIIIDKDGQQRKVNDDSTPGLNLQPDDRTNSIVAVGPKARLDTVKQLIAMLDRPEGAGDSREVMTFVLAGTSPDEAAKSLGALFAKVDAAERPTLLPMDQQGKLAVVGTSAQLAQAAAVIGELDPGAQPTLGVGKPAATPETRAAVVHLSHVTPQAAMGVLERLLVGRQRVMLRYAASPDGKGLIVSGPTEDVRQLEAIVSGLDTAPSLDREVRLLRLSAQRPAEVLSRAVELFGQTTVAKREPVAASLDAASRTVTVVGSREAIAAFAEVLQTVESGARIDRETRLMELRYAKAEELAATLRDLVKSSSLFTGDGGVVPELESVEQTNSLVVSARPEQMTIVEQLVRTLDAQQAGERPPLRVLRLTSTDAAAMAQVLNQTYQQRPPEQRVKFPVDIQADAATNTLLVSAHAGLFPEIEGIVGQLNDAKLDSSGREIRIFPLKVAPAEELARTLDQMYPQPPMPLDPRTRQPRPDLQPPREVVVRADRLTNSLIVDAPSARLAGFEQLVKQLDQQKLPENVELRTYRVQRAQLDAVASTLRSLAASNSLLKGATGAASGVGAAITITTEPISRALIVSGPSPIFAEVERVLKELDAPPAQPPTGLKMYSLQHARAERLQPLLSRLLAARLREWQAKDGVVADPAALLDVASDATTNAMIISAPESIQQVAGELIKSLDTPAAATGRSVVRVIPLSHANAQQAAAAINAALPSMDLPSGGRVSVTPVGSGDESRSLVLSGVEGDLKQIESLISSLDVKPATQDAIDVRTIPLKHARAESVAPMVEQLLARPSLVDQLPQWQKLDYLRTTKGELAPVRVVADRRLNTVVITGPAGVIELAGQVVADLDVEPESADLARPVRVISIESADAAAVAANLQAIFAEETGNEPKPSIRVDAESNLLIVRASQAQMATITPVIEKIEQATANSSRELRLIPIDKSKADARLIAETLQRLLEQRGGMKVEVISAEELLKRGGSERPVEGGSGKGRSLLWPANPAAGISQMLAAAALGHPGPGPAVMPWALAEGSELDDEPAEGTVTIAVDAATNSLIVVGASRTANRVLALAQQLERQMPGEPGKVRVITLPEGVDATSVARLVGSVVSQIGSSSAANPGGFSGRVSAEADPAGGALIVTSNETDFAVLRELIAAVSRPGPSASLTVKVYSLSNVTAQRALRAASDLLSAEPRGSQARRLRSLDLKMETPDGKPVSGIIDPASVRMTADPGGSALIVAAPQEAMVLLDRFISIIDQSPVASRAAIRRFELKNATAEVTATTLQRAFDGARQGGSAAETPRAVFLADTRTNSLLVAGTDAQFAEAERLLVSLDTPMADDGTRVAILPLQVARPTAVRQVIESVLIGRDPAKKERVQITAADDSNMLVIRAEPDQIEQAKGVIAEMDKAETAGLPIRSITLNRADAALVAQSLQQFFDERARAMSRPGQRARQRQVAVVGDRRSGTLVVSASDEDFAQVDGLVKQFDAATSRELQIKVIPLANARASELRQTIDSMVWQAAMRLLDGAAGQQRDSLMVEVDERSNSVVAMGSGEALETVERVVRALDQPRAAEAALAIRAIRVANADPRTVAQAIQSVTTTPSWPRWRGPDPDAVRAEVDPRSRAVVLIGRADRLDQAEQYAKQLDSAATAPDQAIETISLKFARADQIAASLERFFRERSRSQGQNDARVSLIGSRDGNVLVVSAPGEEMGIVKQVLAQMDQPDEGENTRRELFQLKNADARELATALQQQFPRSMSSREGLVIVTPQASTNSVVVSSPSELFEKVSALIAQLDAPPTPDNSQFVTVTLGSAKAEDVAEAIRRALPPQVKVAVTPVRRTNSLLLTGSQEAIKIVMEQIEKLDAQPARSAVEFRRIKLENADAYELAQVVRSLVSRPAGPTDPAPVISSSSKDNTLLISATVDQQEEIRKILDQLDVPSANTRTMEFVPLKFADARATATALDVFFGKSAPEAASPAARNVTIIANPLSKSLVIAADQGEWPAVRALLEKLDNEAYDQSRRLEIISLRHADAVSLAQTLSEAFSAPLRAEVERQRLALQRFQGGVLGAIPRLNGGREAPSVLIQPEESVSVVAERLTNSLIISAVPPLVERIRAVATQLDVPEFSSLPEARVIPLRIGPATQIANALRQMYTDSLPSGPASQRGLRSVVITGEDRSNTLIVRADESQFARIKVLTDSLQQEGDRSRTSVRVLRLANIPAGRVMLTVRNTFAAVAKEGGEALALDVDRTANALVVASSEKVYEQIRAVVEELDAAPAFKDDKGNANAVPGLGQTIFIIDVENNSPEQIRKQLEDLGLTRPQPQDRPGVVGEPVTIVPLASRRALAVVASPQDGQAVAMLVRTLDAAPAFAEQHVAIVRLKTGQAPAIAAAMENLIKARGTPDSASSPAAALVEQVRRLSIHRDGVAEPNLALDLSKPIRIIGETQTNSIVIVSAQGNVGALTDLVKLLDRLPVGEAVVVRFFPLQNASATRLQGVIRELFAQGDRLRQTPATNIRGEPTTEVGRALAGQVAVSVDDRTNALVVAGREEAVALVEIMVKQLDSDRAASWIEPVVIPLRHADATKLARDLRSVLVDGVKDSPEATALQRQVARIRVAIQGGRPQGPDAAPAGADGRLETDIFAPMSSLVIQPEEQLNALIVLGSTANVRAVAELAKMLDVPAAAAENSVRIYPLRFAAADRVSGVLRDVFRQQAAAGTIRKEDDLVISPDPRTNSLVVSTSPRSFIIVEKLMQQLDGQPMSPTVGLSVVPVPDGNVVELAPKIERLMRDRIDSATRGGQVRSPSDTFSVTAEASTHSLIVVATDENLQMVKDLVKVLVSDARALAASETVDVVSAHSARADDLAAAVRELYVDKQNAKRGADAVKISADARLNALVIRGTPEDVAAVRDLVARLEATPVAAVTEIKRIELRRADAADAARLLQNILAGRPIAGGRAVGSRQAQLLRFMQQAEATNIKDKTGRPPTEAEISGAIQEQITLTPEPRTNSVVIVAPTRLMLLIEQLIADLDTTSAGERTIEIFRLKNADSRAMAEVLRDLFNLRQQGNTLVLVPSREQEPEQEGPSFGPPSGVVASNLYPSSDERQQLAITIDARTNSLLVSATVEYLEKVRQVVNELDSVEASEREQLVYPLRNTRAVDIARTLRDYFKGEADTLRQTLGSDRAGSLIRLLEREVTVQGDEKSNRLIVGVSPRYREAIDAIVRELDSTPPQVMIQVLLAEVSLDTASQWGVDFSVGPFGGEGYKIASLAAGTGVASALGVPNLAVSSVDFELLIRALEVQGRLEVLSRPQILVKNNERARIQVGENVALANGVEVLSQTGNTRADVERRDIGIILNVTPSISADGFVSMEVQPEISRLSSRTTQISEEFQAPVIDTRKVETNVSVRDGETIVIGGLIQSRDDERRTKIPVLGDIPIVGDVFKSTNFIHEKNELLVILTPRVIRSGTPRAGEILRQMTLDEIKKTTGAERVLESLPPQVQDPRGEPTPWPSDESGAQELWLPPIEARPSGGGSAPPIRTAPRHSPYAPPDPNSASGSGER
ncbi:MAG: hypothetical protein KF745_10065 [Phycisphaeraceae bacterium]|nr:hypothetical protein [Phycisphaeraceae bacterium]